jgi:acetyltransferase-like isoleucine patch superfamily enzyme
VTLRGRLRSLFSPLNYQSDRTAVIHAAARVVNNRSVRQAIQIGAHTHVKGELLTFAHGGAIRIGAYCFVGEQTHVWSAAAIDIGDRVLISHNVNIFDNTTHPVSAKDRHAQFCSIILEGRHPSKIDLDEKPVRIEDDVLIGCMSIVLSGVTIGRGAIVGAGSVVTRDVTAYTIVAGNPAQLIREVPANER